MPKEKYTFCLLRSTRRLLLPTNISKITTISPYASSHLPSIKIKVLPAPAIIPKTYMKKNEDLKRVLSPHLSIYKSQITSVMSISLRMTGLVLGLMAWIVGVTKLVSENNVDYFVNELQKLELDDGYWTAAKTIIVFPFAFHFVAGVRHLLFDTSKLLDKTQFYATGYVAIALSLALTFYLGMIEDIHSVMDDRQQTKESENKGENTNTKIK